MPSPSSTPSSPAGESPAVTRPQDDHLATLTTKLTFLTVFVAVLAAVSTRLNRRGERFRVTPYELLLLGLSSFRVGRIIAYEGVGAPLREPFTTTRTDSSGAGETTVPEGTGARKVLGELLSCPVCSGTWVAAGLVYGLHLIPRPTRLFMAIMGTSGVAQVLYALTEALTWSARAQRMQCAPD